MLLVFKKYIFLVLNDLFLFWHFIYYLLWAISAIKDICTYPTKLAIYFNYKMSIPAYSPNVNFIYDFDLIYFLLCWCFLNGFSRFHNRKLIQSLSGFIQTNMRTYSSTKVLQSKVCALAAKSYLQFCTYKWKI